MSFINTWNRNRKENKEYDWWFKIFNRRIGRYMRYNKITSFKEDEGILIYNDHWDTIIPKPSYRMFERLAEYFRKLGFEVKFRNGIQNYYLFCYKDPKFEDAVKYDYEDDLIRIFGFSTSCATSKFYERTPPLYKKIHQISLGFEIAHGEF